MFIDFAHKIWALNYNSAGYLFCLDIYFTFEFWIVCYKLLIVHIAGVRHRKEGGDVRARPLVSMSPLPPPLVVPLVPL